MNEWTGQRGSLTCPQVAGEMGYSLEERDSAPFMNNRPSGGEACGLGPDCWGPIPSSHSPRSET